MKKSSKQNRRAEMREHMEQRQIDEDDEESQEWENEKQENEDENETIEWEQEKEELYKDVI